MDEQLKADVVRETSISFPKAPKQERVSISHFVEFKKPRVVYEKQIDEKIDTLKKSLFRYHTRP